MARRNATHQPPLHRCTGKIAGAPMAQRQIAFPGRRAGQGDDGADIFGRDPGGETPGRGASLNRASTVSPLPGVSSHRARQVLTVLRHTPRASAVSPTPNPSAKNSTDRARFASCCGVERARTSFPSSTRSALRSSVRAALRPISILRYDVSKKRITTTKNKALKSEPASTPRGTR